MLSHLRFEIECRTPPSSSTTKSRRPISKSSTENNVGSLVNVDELLSTIGNSRLSSFNDRSRNHQLIYLTPLLWPLRLGKYGEYFNWRIQAQFVCALPTLRAGDTNAGLQCIRDVENAQLVFVILTPY